MTNYIDHASSLPYCEERYAVVVNTSHAVVIRLVPRYGVSGNYVGHEKCLWAESDALVLDAIAAHLRLMAELREAQEWAALCQRKNIRLLAQCGQRDTAAKEWQRRAEAAEAAAQHYFMQVTK